MKLETLKKCTVVSDGGGCENCSLKCSLRPAHGIYFAFLLSKFCLAPSETTPKDIIDPPEFIKRLAESGIHDLNDLDGHLRNPPDADEIKNTINKLKERKASSDIPAEYLKAIVDCPKYINMLEHLYYEVWVDVVLADVWRKQTITALYKNKGSRKDCTNYRGLCIGSTFLKLAMTIILERIKPWV